MIVVAILIFQGLRRGRIALAACLVSRLDTLRLPFFPDFLFKLSHIFLLVIFTRSEVQLPSFRSSIRSNPLDMNADRIWRAEQPCLMALHEGFQLC